MAVLVTQAMALDGSAPSLLPAGAGGDRFTPNDRTFLRINNGSASPITATLVTPGTLDGLAIADRAVTVPATSTRDVPLGVTAYRSSDGLGDVTYTAVTTVTVGVLFAPVTT